ncbi:elongation of very long chain fatty acids protein 1-like [Photinus pyralis]|uniref:elongation of very long chain fatty acids protein 1-like n=1 Tax=Photinus pyralis TaxID=7054 RepID=UPI001266FA60|nr:elongation of very long chain fatty acids protein 1-like [Photinus pyralis]
METATEYYNFMFVTQADKRTTTWPLMSSPLLPLALICGYLFAVYHFLPKYMTGRRPYRLKGYLWVYNLAQVVSCFVIIYGLTASGWRIHHLVDCQVIDLSNNPNAIRTAQCVWFYFALKVVELTETFVFILRKKYKQVSPLHVFHHASTVFCAWVGVKFYPGGMSSIPIILNSIVHIVMYSYYFLSSLGPGVQRKWLQPIKPIVTRIQIIQLLILLVLAPQAFSPRCAVPDLLIYLCVPDFIINLILFLRFYARSYNKK